MARRIESWLPVVGWQGYYDVSDYGRVRSVDRWVWGGRRSGLRFSRGRVLRASVVNEYGHLRVHLSRDGVATSRLVHRLVLLAFAGPCPDGQQTRHGPGGPADNRWPEGLRWGTRADNNGADKIRDGTAQRGERAIHARLTERVVLDARARRAAGATYTSLAREYGVNPGTIRNAVTGQTWRHLPGAVRGSTTNRGEQNGSARLTAVIVLDCRARHAEGATYSALAREYGVATTTVRLAVTGQRWRHLPMPERPSPADHAA